MSEEAPLVEVRRAGMRYLAKTYEAAYDAALPSCQYPEDVGTPYTIKTDTMKEYACKCADAIAKGVVKADIWKAREMTKKAFTFDERPRKLREWKQDDVFRNMAEFLHCLCNVMGFSYADEWALIQQWTTQYLWGKQ